MLDQLKKTLGPFLFIGVSIFLLPSVAYLIGGNANERNFILNFLINATSVFQSLGILLAAFSASGFLFVLYKEKRARDVIKRAITTDPIWDIESLKSHTKFIFYKVQTSWKDRELGSLKDYVTKKFEDTFLGLLKNKLDSDQTPLEITETRIICCQDFKKNENDKFVGYVIGSIGDSNDENSYKEFSEMYHFIRYENDWLLNKMDVGNTWNLFFFESRFEG